MPKEVTTVRFDPEITAQLAKVSELCGFTAAELVRQCVRLGLPILEEVYGDIATRFATAMQRFATTGIAAPSSEQSTIAMNDAPGSAEPLPVSRHQAPTNVNSAWPMPKAPGAADKPRRK